MTQNDLRMLRLCKQFEQPIKNSIQACRNDIENQNVTGLINDGQSAYNLCFQVMQLEQQLMQQVQSLTQQVQDLLRNFNTWVRHCGNGADNLIRGGTQIVNNQVSQGNNTIDIGLGDISLGIPFINAFDQGLESVVSGLGGGGGFFESELESDISTSIKENKPPIEVFNRFFEKETRIPSP